MIRSTPQIAFEDLRDSLARNYELTSEFRDRLREATVIELSITPNKIYIKAGNPEMGIQGFMVSDYDAENFIVQPEKDGDPA